ncbi:MAG: tRNA preQ1(34) S-adenosylmethionine ribosyltransferase-isomerase QueA [bacterium]
MTAVVPEPRPSPAPSTSAADFDYELPEALIAQHPAPRRADSRLLHLAADAPPRHLRFVDFPALLRPADLLVLNETEVLPARLEAARATGGAVEVLLVRPEGDAWRALLKPARRLRIGETLTGGGGAFRLTVREAGAEGLVAAEGLPMEEILRRFGETPLPPYVRRAATPADRERYQTVYARVPGAVAAPTAGLHFDEAMLAAVAAAGVDVTRLVLHVGPGTFRPLPDGSLEGHVLEAERYEVPAETASAIRAARVRGGRVVAVGTTVVRALESWALAGEPATGTCGETRLFIRGAFDFRVVDALLTNFHLPRSSLLCLVAAFSGRERVLAAYAEAVRERYRFYSYGDATFLERRRG